MSEPTPRSLRESRVPPSDTTITRMHPDAHAHICAEMMCSTEPWVTLGRTHEMSLTTLRDPDRETYVALRDGRVVGFVIVCMQGAFVGYIQSVCVAADLRGQGIGSTLIGFAEERIFAITPNVFMCVSSFNTAARRLYVRLNYEVIGELRDYLVAGHSEILLRKTIGPLPSAPSG